MAEAARQFPAVDPVRAEAHALLDRLLDLLRAATSTPATVEDTVLPLSTAADRLGWTRDRLRRYCLSRGVAVAGRGKSAAVDLREVRAALAGQRRVTHDAPSRELADDLREAFGARR